MKFKISKSDRLVKKVQTAREAVKNYFSYEHQTYGINDRPYPWKNPAMLARDFTRLPDKVKWSAVTAGLAVGLAAGLVYPKPTQEFVQSYVDEVHNYFNPPKPIKDAPIETASFDRGYSREGSDFLKKSIAEQRDLIERSSRRVNLDGMTGVAKVYEKNIRETAARYDVPAEIALGVATLESGAAIDRTSPAKCCKGLMQVNELMGKKYDSIHCTGEKKEVQDTATIKQVVNGKIQVKEVRRGPITDYECAGGQWIDLRSDPVRNMDSGIHFLADNYRQFGDWFFAMQSYHAGVPNVQRGIANYMKSAKKRDVDFNAINASFLKNEGITWSDVMMNEQSRGFFARLKDQSHLYPAKAMASYYIFSGADQGNLQYIPYKQIMADVKK